MDKHILKAQKRTVFGRKVKKLREEGLLPANIFGKKIKSQAVSVNLKDFLKVHLSAGKAALVEIDLEAKKLPVLITNIANNPLTGLPLHADFHQVDLKEKVTANVPLEITGEAPAVKDKIGVLLKNIDEIEVEALPNDLPDKISVDISCLKAIDEAIKVSDLKVSPQVKITADPILEVVKIAPLVSKEAEKMAKEEAEKQAAESAAAEDAQAPKTAEVEKEAGESKPEAKKQDTAKAGE